MVLSKALEDQVESFVSRLKRRYVECSVSGIHNVKMAQILVTISGKLSVHTRLQRRQRSFYDKWSPPPAGAMRLPLSRSLQTSDDVSLLLSLKVGTSPLLQRTNNA